MNASTCLITGATGFVGSHAAEAFVRRRWTVRALAREESDTAHLEALGVEIVRGGFEQSKVLENALAGVDSVVHCAAKVGDWGPAEEYQRANVGGLRHLLEAVRRRSIRRFVHLSSLGVYEARDHFSTDESVPPPDRHIDGYTQSKVDAEKLALQYHREHGVPIVVLRPGFIYGPRDRTVLPKLINNFERKRVRYIGSGEQAMNTTYVGNLVDAIFLALETPQAVGQIYNLTDNEYVSKRRFLDTVADLAGLDRAPSAVPLWYAKMVAWILERSARLVGTKKPPKLTQARLKFLGLNLSFSVEKAMRELNYRPRIKFAEGMQNAINWWKAHQASHEEGRESLRGSQPSEIKGSLTPGR